MKRLYHSDGRAYTSEEYKAEQDKRLRRRRDYLAIFAILFFAQVALFINMSGIIYLQFVFSYLFLYEFTYALLFTPFVWGAFDYCVRQKKSLSLFLMSSLLVSVVVFSIRLVVLLVMRANPDIRGVPLMVDNSLSFEGMLNLYLFDPITYFPFIALSFFLYNPFKDMK